VEEGGELVRRVKVFRRQILPALFLENPPVQFVVPEDIEGWPWASSSAQARRTMDELPKVGGSITSSTSHRWERTCTNSPTLGWRSGTVLGCGQAGQVDVLIADSVGSAFFLRSRLGVRCRCAQHPRPPINTAARSFFTRLTSLRYIKCPEGVGKESSRSLIAVHSDSAGG
jgi:hypothetical protein